VSYSVQLTDAATDNVRSILRWLERRSPAGADAWYRKFLEVLEILKERADSLGLAPESTGERSLRQVLFRTRRGKYYRALYEIRESNVFVVHVRGHGQDLVS
jgi:plasmid stabilization system protein ParE